MKVGQLYRYKSSFDSNIYNNKLFRVILEQPIDRYNIQFLFNKSVFTVNKSFLEKNCTFVGYNSIMETE